MKKIAITGHRPNKLGNDYNLTSPLIVAIRAQIVDHIVTNNLPDNVILITGMALGIDTLFARIAISLDIPFIAAIPCAGQSSMWPIEAKIVYQYLVNHRLCTKEWISTEPYSPALMQKRNIWMVDNCDELIAVWDGTNGGTANCVRYAGSVSKPILRIDPTLIPNLK